MPPRFVSKSALFVAIAAVSAGFASPAFAHVGDHAGGLASGLSHPFTGLDHMLAMVAVGLWASQLGGRALWLLPAMFVTVMAAGAVIGSSGIALPWVELGILASVVVLGAAVAFRMQMSVGLGAALVAIFALFHGHAHGTELPAAGSALLYGIGFMVATAALHAIGIGIGTLVRQPVVMRAAGGAIAAAGLVLLLTP